MPDISLSPAVIVERKAGLLSTELDGELILMSIEAGKYFSLNATGAGIWRRFETPAPVRAVLLELGLEYDAQPAVIEHDVMSLLSDLMNYGLIRVKGQCEAN